MQNIEEIKKEILQDKQSLDLQAFKKKYLGKDSILTKLFSQIKEIPVEQRKEYGKNVNEVKILVDEILSEKVMSNTVEDNASPIDVTAPFDTNVDKDKRPLTHRRKGNIHPLMAEFDNIVEIFRSMGFDVVESRQLDDDYHMFESLNIPKGHPARDIWDTFWTDENLIPPAQTSTMQNRIMKQYKNPPIRVVVPGRCFRNEATDASHEHTFYQVEGIYVDKGISMAHMLGTIKTYLEAFFETELDIKVQPAFFPFTEPDCEFLISCPFCKQTGCSVCGYKGWLEIMGCGMIHPNVLKEAGIDSDVYSGFAWGFGLDRLVMLKHGIQELRRFHSGDLSFLKQF